MEPLNKRYPKLGPATYDTMPVKPRAGQRVRISYEAEWACWDSIQRPITKREQEGSSNYLAPRDAKIEIVDFLVINDEDLKIEYYYREGQGINERPAGVGMTHIPTGFIITESNSTSRLENMRVGLHRLMELINNERA